MSLRGRLLALYEAVRGYKPEPAEPPPRRPELGEFFSGRREDLGVDDYVRELTPSRLATILREAEDGDLSRQAEVFERCESDAHVQSVYATRKLAAASKAMQLAPSGDHPLSEAASELSEELIAGIENWDESLRDLYDATGKGFAASQIVWEERAGRFIVPRLSWWHQREFTVDADNPEVLRVFTSVEPNLGEFLQPWQWIVHRAKARSATLASSALFRTVAWLYLFKHYSIRDWVIFSEAYGMPRRIGKYPAGSADAERAAIRAAVMSLGKDGAAVIPEGAAIEFIQATQPGTSPFEALASFCNGEISKAIVGQTLTTEVGSTGGNRALGEVHKRVSEGLTRADCKAMARTLRKQLLAPMVGFNLGWDVPVPELSFVIEEKKDLYVEAQVAEILVTKVGIEGSLEQLRKKFNLDAPKDEADTIRPPRPAPVPGAPALSELRGLIAMVEAEKKSSQDWATLRASSNAPSSNRSTAARTSVESSPSTSQGATP